MQEMQTKRKNNLTQKTNKELWTIVRKGLKDDFAENEMEFWRAKEELEKRKKK